MAVEIDQDYATRAVIAGPAKEPASDLFVAIQRRFRNREQDFVLDVSFSVDAGIAIVFGASGAGKTTLLDCIAGLQTPDAGKIAAGDRVLFGSGTSILARQRRIGYVFQDLALFPHMTAEANIEFGLTGLPADERRRRAEKILESLHIPHLKDRKPAQISGGERQRVALARALVTDPCILLLDEPLAALDAPTKSHIIADLRAWNHSHRIPILYVTHSREEVFALGERVLVLENGRIIAQGTPHEVMTAPSQETVAQLAGFENIFDGVVVAAHPARGTMSCRLASSELILETPLVRADVGSKLRVGIPAGDILLATEKPVGLSARNVFQGMLKSMEQRDVIISAVVECGVEFEVHLTLAARDSLHLGPGQPVWLVLKTHSCRLMA